MKKKLTAILLSLLMSVQALPFYALAEEAETPTESGISLELPEEYSEQNETHEHDDGCADCADAELSASTSHSHDDYTAWTSTTSMPTTAGKYYLTADVSISSQWNVPSGTTTLCLNGYTLQQTGTSRVINIGSGCSLTLEDCNGANRSALFDYGPNTVYTPSEIGLYTVTGGMIYGGVNQSGGGGGVYVAAGGTFTMNGGNIVACRTTMNGGGVMVDGGTFTMNGGMIVGNAANGTLGGCGGGVAVSGNGAYFYFYGGRIKSNYASQNGSAVYIMSSGAFSDYGGYIMYNFGTKFTIFNDDGTVNYFSGKFNNYHSGAEDYYSPMLNTISSRRIPIEMNDGTENVWKSFDIKYGEALPDFDELPQRKGYSATAIYDDPELEYVEDYYDDNCYFTAVDGMMKGRDYTGWDYFGSGRLYIHWHKHTLTDEYVDLGNGTHKRKCSECGEYDLPEEHTFDGDFVDNGNGTHSRTCACGARGPQIAHCDLDEHICGVCGGTEKVSKTTILPYMQVGRIEDSTAYSYEFDDFTVTADYCGDYGLYAGYSYSYDDRVTITGNRPDICITGVDFDISYIGYPDYFFNVGYSSGVCTDTLDVDFIKAGMTFHVAGIDANSFSFIPLDLGKYYISTMVVHYAVDAHDYGDEYRDNKDGTHSRKCTDCGEYGETETHSFSSGVYRNNEDGTHSEKCAYCDAYGAPEHTEAVVFDQKCLASNVSRSAYAQTGTDFKISATLADFDGTFTVGMGKMITFEALNEDTEIKRIEMTLAGNAGNAVHLIAIDSGDIVEGADAKDGDTLHINDINASTFTLASNAYVYVKDIVIYYSLGETTEPHNIVNHVCVCGESTEHTFTGPIRDNFDGTHSRQCVDCGEWTTGVAHTFVNHVCSVCGVYDAVSEDLTENFAFDPVFIVDGEYNHKGLHFKVYSNCAIGQGIRGGGKLDNADVYPVIRIEALEPDVVITQIDYTEGYGCSKWTSTGISAGYKQTTSTSGASSGSVRRVYKIMRPVFTFEGGGDSTASTITAKALTIHYAHINHSYTGDYRDNEDGTHSRQCTICGGWNTPETHSYTDHECICGKTVEHVFDGEYKDNGDGTHSQLCIGCGEYGNTKEHSFVNHVCACGATSEHSFTGACHDNEDGTHTYQCENCDVWGTPEAHSYTDHVCACGKTVEHDLNGAYKDNGDGTHSQTCIGCGECGTAEDHTFVDHECVCGATNDHSFTGAYRDNGDGTHSRKCTGCGEYDAAEKHTYEDHVCACGATNDHDYSGAYRDNGDGTHSRKCTGCDGYGNTEAHNYVNGACACGAISIIEWTNANALPTASGLYCLATDVTLAAGWQVPSGVEIELDLNGHTISRNLSAAVYNGYVIATSGKLTLTDSSADHTGLITGGYSSSTGGGISVNAGSLTMENITVSGNRSTSNAGGINISSVATVVLTDCHIDGNSANAGGGILNSGMLTVNGGSMSGNTATSRAGGLYIDSAIATFTDCEIKNNRSESYGGAIFENYYATVTFDGCTVTGNSAKNGGGACGMEQNSSKLNLKNTAVTGNSVDQAVDDLCMGGGILYKMGSLTLDGDVIIFDNTCADEVCNICIINDSVISASSTFVASTMSADSKIGCNEKVLSTIVGITDSNVKALVMDNGDHVTREDNVLVTHTPKPVLTGECIDNGDGTHSFPCELCTGYCPGVEHSYEDHVCVCGNTVEHAYTGEYKDNEDGTHSRKCIGCDESGTPEAHTFVNHVCVCGAVSEHSFTGDYKDNEDGTHSRKCTGCDEYGTTEAHSYTDHVCKCGKTVEHVFDGEYKDNEDGTHSRQCIGCGEYGTAEAHSYTDHVCVCGNTVEHAYTGEYKDNENGTHSRKCIGCGEYGSAEAHAFVNHVCVCGAVSDHSYTGEYKDNEDGTHSRKCTGCDEYGTPEAHTYTDHECACGNTVEHAYNGDYKDNGDGTHSRLCIGCGEYGATEAHNEVNHVCTICGFKVSEHSFTGSYVNNGDGSHKQQCTGCGEYSPSEPHTYVNGVCVCGQTSPMAWTNTAGLPAYSGEYRLEKDVTLTGKWNVPQGTKITLDLNGHTIKRSLSAKVADGSVISTNGDLTLIDTSTGHTGLITGGKTTGNGGGIYVGAGSVTMENITVSGNDAANGGAIYVAEGASLDMTDCHIDGNKAGGTGGIYNSGTLTVTGGSISGNTASSGNVGAVYTNKTSTTTITDCEIKNNTSTSNGGAFFIDGTSTVQLEGCTVSGNSTTTNGGGLYIPAANAKVTLTDCHIDGNTATGAAGIYNSGTLTVNGGSLNGNHATNNSGGFYCGAGSATFTDCEIKNNRSDNYGGAFFVDYTSSLTLDGCTVTGNSAKNGGGAIEMEKANCVLVLEDTEITGNSVDQVNGGWYKGGGIHYYLGTVTLKGDIILCDNTCAGTVSNLCYRNQSVTYNASALSATSKVGTPETVLSVITGITESNVSGLFMENGDHVGIEDGKLTPHTPDYTGDGKDNGDGTHSHKCSKCDVYGPAEGHTFVDNVCTECGFEMEPIVLELTSIRTTGLTGLRFAAYVTDDELALSESCGFLVARENTDLASTPELLVFNDSNSASGTNSFGINYTSGETYNKEKGINKFYATDGEAFGMPGVEGNFFTGVMTGIPRAYYAERLVARPYMVVDGVTLYGDCYSKSLYENALALKNAGYPGLDEAGIAYIDDIIAAVEG